MQADDVPSYIVSSNDVACTSQFYKLKRTKQNWSPEETKLNCSTFNYQSNSKLDSTCLETYRYDHSIYFKTIGDIRNDKNNVRHHRVRTKYPLAVTK